MASSADVQRSSKKKAVAADRKRKAVLDRLARDEGDVFKQGMELHRRTMFEAYGDALSNGWMPQDITPEWLASETKSWLGTNYEDDYYRLGWDSEMQPGLAAAGQSTYDVTIPEREVMQEAWPIPESVPKKRKFDSDDDDDDADEDSTVLTLLPQLNEAAGDAQDPEFAPTTGRKSWKKLVATDVEPETELKKLKRKLEKYSEKIRKTPRNKKKKRARYEREMQLVSSTIMALKAATPTESTSEGSSSLYPNKTLPNDLKDSYEFGKSSETVLDFIERLQDWMVLAPPKMHSRFLLQALSGGTKLLYRKLLMENPGLKFKEALIWMKANCTARDCKQKLLEKMDTITMKSGEHIQVFLTRATALRVKLLDAGIGLSATRRLWPARIRRQSTVLMGRQTNLAPASIRS